MPECECTSYRISIRPKVRDDPHFLALLERLVYIIHNHVPPLYHVPFSPSSSAMSIAELSHWN